MRLGTSGMGAASLRPYKNKRPVLRPARTLAARRLPLRVLQSEAQKNRTGFACMRACSSSEQPAFVATFTAALVAFTRLFASM